MEKHNQQRNSRLTTKSRNYFPQPKNDSHEIRTFIADGGQNTSKKSPSVFMNAGRSAGNFNRSAAASAPKTSFRRKIGSGHDRGIRKFHSGRPQSKNPQTENGKKNFKDIPPPLGDTIRIIPLGGVEEIGRNMTVIEYKNDIVVIDAGLQFSEEDTPGIDYILPNTKYLEERKNKIRALLVTHGHLDHIGGIPFIMDRIGNPPIYTRKLTALMIEKRQMEYPDNQKLDIRIIDKNEAIKIGDLKIRFFSVTHTIPDCMGIIIETAYGMIVTPGDFKLSHTNEIVDPKEEAEYSIFEKEKVLLLMADSTNIANPGFSTPERLVHKTLEDIIGKSTGRLIIGTFSSQFERMIKIIQVAEATGKKIVVEGRSMKTNIDIAIAAGLISPKKGTIIPSEEMENYPPDKIVMLATGAQGEDFAALMRMTNKSHKTVQIRKGDTVVLSSSIIPGNERTVQKLKDNLARAGAKIIHYRTSDVYIHSTGHANRGEIEWLHKKIKPKFFVPIHGSHYMLRLHEELAQSCGTPEKNIVVPDDGTIIEIRDKGETITTLKDKASDGFMMVDGFAIGNVQEVVIRDRQMLAEDGMFVVVASINTSTGKLRKSPDIISRGFVYLRESQDLLQQSRIIIKKTVEETTAGMNPINFEYVKTVLTDNLSRFLFQKTAKRPIVIPVLIGV